MLTIYEHEASLNHITPPGHPERVDRMVALSPVIRDIGTSIETAPLGTDEAILLAHPQSYLDQITAAAPETGYVSLDPDTHMSPGSLTAARHAVGGNTAGVIKVMLGGARAVFVATRPPGHHAEKTTAMGFCLFSNAAIAARYALENFGLNRVAIADFDVHHGNGTQDVVWDDPRILFASSHQSPLYPGTGAEHETGAGNIFNAELPAMTGSAGFRAAWKDRLLPAIHAHEPELIIMSAGFDAHRRDPLAQLMLEDDDFYWITQELCNLAEIHSQGRVVSTLEGGYDLDALASAGAAHLTALKEHAS